MKWFALLFLFSCSDSLSDEPSNEVQVFTYDACQMSFSLKTNSFSSGRYDLDCEFESIARFNNISSDTIYFEATAGKKRMSGKKYHEGKITEIEIRF